MNKDESSMVSIGIGSVLFLALLGTSVLSLALIGLDTHAGQQTPPPTRTPTYTIYSGYNYTANLAPNIVYDNRTAISGEPYLFLGLVKYLDISYATYVGGASLRGQYSMRVTIGDGDTWEKTLIATGPRNFTDAFHGEAGVNLTEVEHIISEVRRETKSYSSTYELVLSAAINGELSSSNYSKPIALVNNHAITLDYSSNKLVFSDMSKRTGGALGSQPSAQRERSYLLGSPTVPYITLLASVGGMGLVYYRFFTNRSMDPVRRAEEEYSDIIVDAGAPPRTDSLVRLPDLAELARIAVMLEKPVLRGPGVYYVVDESTLYLYEAPQNSEDPENTQ